MVSLNLFNIDTISVKDYFSLFSEKKAKSYIWLITSEKDFRLGSTNSLEENDGQNDYSPGTYYLRDSKKQVEFFKKFAVIEKLSFTQLITIADLLAKSILIDKKKMEEIIETGSMSEYYHEEIETIDITGLEKMCGHVKKKHFCGLKGLIKRIFSALNNLYIKACLVFLDSKFYFPGDTSAWADKVIKKVKENKAKFVFLVYQKSIELLSEKFNLSKEEIETSKFEELNKVYKKQALKVHPDKKGSEAEFVKLSRSWNLYREFHQLKEKAEEEGFIFKGEAGYDQSTSKQLQRKLLLQ